MKKRAFSILLTAVLLFSFSLIVVAAEKPYVAEYLFCPGSISYYSYWTSDGEYLYCNDGGYGIYKVDIATGEYEDMDTEVSYNGKTYEISFLGGLHYNPRNGALIASSCKLERENALSGSVDKLDGYYAVDITNQRVVYKGSVTGIFSNGDILQIQSYSNGIQKAKRLTYPNYTTTSDTYTYYDVDEYGTDYGIVNVGGTDYLLNSKDIYRATGGYPTCSTYGNIVGAGSDSFVMIRDANVIYFTSSGTVLEQFSLDDVEEIGLEELENVGSVFHSKKSPLMISDNGDIVYVDTEWDQFCKISKRPVGVTGVSLNKTSVALSVGDSTTLTATVSPSNATNKAVTWKSSNTSVATVSGGDVTAKAAGTATITVTTTDGGYSATCRVTVKNPAVTGVSLDCSQLSLNVGDSQALTATVLPTNAYDKTVNWKSSDTSVVTVSDGVVTAKGAGTATVVVTTNDGGFTDICTVTVTKVSTLPPVDMEGLLDYGEDENGIGWYLYESGFMLIKGNGDMADYKSSSAIPWYSERENITEVFIEDGVTGIGERAFYNCENLEKITIPASVLRIGTYTFRNCDNLYIWGEKGSYAEEYAREDWYPFNGITNLCVDVTEYDTEYSLFITDLMDDVPDGAFVYVALYNRRGKILSVGTDRYEYGLALPDVPKKAGGAYIKVFVWDASLKPLAYDYEHWIE